MGPDMTHVLEFQGHKGKYTYNKWRDKKLNIKIEAKKIAT